MALRFAVGAALGPTAVIVLYELFGVPVHALTIALIGAAGLVLMVIDERRSAAPTPIRPATVWAVGLLTTGTFASTLWGALRYPGFGGRDSWHHALGTAWLLESGQLRQPFEEWPVIHYVDGYPPAFEIILAFASAPFGGDIADPLKSVAALVGAASVLAVYFLGRRVVGSATGGVIGAILYAVAPGALGRHVWGHSLAVVLILTGLACTVSLRRSHRLLPAAAICFGGAVLAAPSQGVKGLILAALTSAVAWASDRAWGRRVSLAMVGAGVVASVWFLPLLARTGIEPTAIFSSMDNPEIRRAGVRWHPDGRDFGGWTEALRGSEHREYGLDDVLFFRPHVSVQSIFGPKRINFIVPEGIGAPVLALTLIGLLLGPIREKGCRGFPARATVGLWVLFSALGVAGASIGISLYTWRFWLLLVPIASVAAALGAVRLSEGPIGSRRHVVIASVAAVVGITQLILAVLTDTAAGLWRFWFLNPSFLLVTVSAAAWVCVWFVRNRAYAARLTAVVILLHVLIASPARLRALTIQVESRVFLNAVEAAGYLAIPSVTPKRASIFPLSGGGRYAAVVGLDRTCRPWDRGWFEVERNLEKDPCSFSPTDFVRDLSDIGVDYIAVDPSFRLKLELNCPDPNRFRSMIIGLLEVPGTSLVLSSPPSEKPSDSRVVVLRMPDQRAPSD